MCDYDCQGCNCNRDFKVGFKYNYVVWPAVAGIGLLTMFWLARYV